MNNNNTNNNNNNTAAGEPLHLRILSKARRPTAADGSARLYFTRRGADLQSSIMIIISSSSSSSSSICSMHCSRICNVQSQHSGPTRADTRWMRKGAGGPPTPSTSTIASTITTTVAITSPVTITSSVQLFSL